MFAYKRLNYLLDEYRPRLLLEVLLGDGLMSIDEFLRSDKAQEPQTIRSAIALKFAIASCLRTPCLVQ
jgi:hypothetical protein